MTDFSMQRQWGPKPNYPNVRACDWYSPHFYVIAGPCSIEDPEQVIKIAAELKKHRITFMRGGVYRAGTYPPKDGFQFKKELFLCFVEIAKAHGLKTIVEVLDVRDIDFIAQYVDAVQIGARHMQDYALLAEASRLGGMVVTLKRGLGSTLDEFLGAAEYLARGNCIPILIERGGSSILDHVRWDLSISMIPAIKKITSLPVLVDASHGTGRRDLVRAMTLAGVAAGADGFLCETHFCPEKSISDADQAYPLEKFGELLNAAMRVSEAIRE